METLQSRVSSFARSSKRGKQPSKSTAAPKWPHPASFKATPDTLAEAGFYFSPTAEYRDNVTCFICDKELSDWDRDDDPFVIHWDKCTNSCSWAMVRCSLKLDLNDDGSYTFANPTRLPTSKTMEKARLQTYTINQTWPHDAVRGHSANSKKMAKAGFVYTPHTSGDDTATCFYCGISLSGWDEDDDPLEEHRKREERARAPCPFFSASPSSSASVKPASRASARVTSKPPSRAASHSKTSKTVVEVEELEEASSEQGAVPPQKNPAGSSRKRTGTKTPSDVTGASSKPTASRRSARSKDSKGKVAEPEASEGSGPDAGTAEPGKKVSRSKRKTKTSGKTRVHSVREEAESEQAEAGVFEVPRPKRGRPPSKKRDPSKQLRGKNSSGDITQQTPATTQAHTIPQVHPEPEISDTGSPSHSPMALDPDPPQKATLPVQNIVTEQPIQPTPPAWASSLTDLDQRGHDGPAASVGRHDNGGRESSPSITHGDLDSERFVTPPAASSSPQTPPAEHTSPKLVPEQFANPAPPPELLGVTSDPIIPLLSLVPVERLTSLTEEECTLTIEQFIRREIEKQYQNFKEDGERRIGSFRERAAETRRTIEAS